MRKVGVFCASNEQSINFSILRYLEFHGCDLVIAVTTQPRQVELPSSVIQVPAKANLGDVSRLIEAGDQVEWVLSGSKLLNVLLAHQWHVHGESIWVMVSWWAGGCYKRRFYPTTSKPSATGRR